MTLSILRINEKLLEYLQDRFPERKKTKVFQLESLSKGWETELYSFIYTYEEANNEYKEDLILRIYPGTNIQNKTKKEYDVLKVLHKAGYPVPETHILELNERFLEKPFIIMDRISGSDMGDDFFKTLQEGNIERLQEEILPILNNLFVQLHRLDWKILLEERDSTSFENLENFINNKLNKFESYLEEDQLPELKPILNWLKKNKDEIEVEIAIIHRDFHPHNIMISNEGKAFVIDWPACSLGDYREDLGWTLLLTGAYTTKEVRNMLLESYESVKGAKVSRIEFFEVLAAFRRLRDIMRVFKYGAETSGMRKEAKEQILETLSHVNYVISLVKEITKTEIPEVEDFIQSIIRS